MLMEDDGYYFGIGAFETISVEQGKPQFLKEHYKRLMHTLKFLEIHRDLEEIKKKTEEALAEGEMQNGRKALKVTVSQENLIINVRENPYKKADYERGFSAAFSSIRRNETSPLVFHKTLNYGDCIMEKRKGKKAGIDEPIFLNTKNEISEGATTNVFFIKDKKIYTPAKECGLLPGIIRQYLLETYPVEEKQIFPEDISQYDEMFVTNSLLGIMPVKNLGVFQFRSMEQSKKIYENIRKRKSF